VNSIEKGKKWYSHLLPHDELKKFITKAHTGRENKKAFIGQVVSEAAKRIEAVCGKKVLNIMLESEGIRHSLNKSSHNLREGDLLYIPDIINTATDIRLSGITHQNNACLELTKDIGGKITLVVEVRIHYGGWLALVTCYRHKK
jgi:hypothetical protein